MVKSQAKFEDRTQTDLTVAPLAWRTIAEVQQRLVEDLDRDWDLGAIATLAGYDSFHFAHMFAEVVGEPPLRYIRRLRMERAAHELARDPKSIVSQIASRAGYRSLEAFSRSFSRLFGRSPRAFRRDPSDRMGSGNECPAWKAIVDPRVFPEGLDPRPQIARLGPMWGWALRTKSFDDLHEIGQVMAQLLAAAPPSGPWQFGGIAQPWGWRGAAPRDLRVFRQVPEGCKPPAPLLPWRFPRGFFACFEFNGPASHIATCCGFLVDRWIPSAGLRAAFASLFTLVENPFALEHTRARIHVPIESMSQAQN
ncbi:MAG: helix-turn-helix transcriptional regulator [Polyangiaceae bacterium]|nr:helix-turn-helix transcriptional regulator [Polyangiaceae bacterium]